ncbi:MAG: chemotaxis protein CheB [Aquisalimonadaceae bacterium]
MSVTEPGSSAVPQRRVEIGLIGATGESAALLRSGLEAHGLRVRPLPGLRDYLMMSGAERAGLQVLLVQLAGARESDLEALDELMETSDIPVVYNETEVQGRARAWMRRLAGKLLSLSGPALDATRPDTAVRSRRHTPVIGPTVWVLGASFGGPEAVKRFLTSMPSVPDAVFFLAQHIGDGFIDLLASQLNRSTAFTVRSAADGIVLQPGHVYVAPVDHLVKLEDGDIMRLVPDSQRRVYRPSIDTLMKEVARHYRMRAGAVVFSGMGNDGTKGVQYIVELGGEVWAQSTASCSISSMPDCAAETGVVSRRGSPEELSTALVQYLAARQRAPA